MPPHLPLYRMRKKRELTPLAKPNSEILKRLRTTFRLAHRRSPYTMSYLASITQLVATPRSVAIEDNLLQSFVLDDIAAWGPLRVEQALKKLHDYPWFVTIFDEFFQIFDQGTV